MRVHHNARKRMGAVTRPTLCVCYVVPSDPTCTGTTCIFIAMTTHADANVVRPRYTCLANLQRYTLRTVHFHSYCWALTDKTAHDYYWNMCVGYVVQWIHTTLLRICELIWFKSEAWNKWVSLAGLPPEYFQTGSRWGPAGRWGIFDAFWSFLGTG